MTADDLLLLNDGGQRYELVRGALKVMSPSGFEHGEIVGHMTVVIGSFVHEQGLGRVLGAETGFKLTENPDTVRAPDIAFVAAHRSPAPAERKKFPRLAPDLVVEVCSPHDKQHEVRSKVEDYIAAGVRLIWVVDPATRTITAHRPASEARVIGWDDEVDGHDVLPGFRRSVADLFPARRFSMSPR